MLQKSKLHCNRWMSCRTPPLTSLDDKKLIGDEYVKNERKRAEEELRATKTIEEFEELADELVEEAILTPEFVRRLAREKFPE